MFNSNTIFFLLSLYSLEKQLETETYRKEEFGKEREQSLEQVGVLVHLFCLKNTVEDVTVKVAFARIIKM